MTNLSNQAEIDGIPSLMLIESIAISKNPGLILQITPFNPIYENYTISLEFLGKFNQYNTLHIHYQLHYENGDSITNLSRVLQCWNLHFE
jgi:hypothetical protein